MITDHASLRARIERLATTVVADVVDELGTGPTPAIDASTELYGGSLKLDSIALVTIVAELEHRLSDDLGFDVVLADESAMSRRHSPFRSIESLVEHALHKVTQVYERR